MPRSPRGERLRSAASALRGRVIGIGEMMNTLSRRFLLCAIGAGLLGMAMGIYMGIADDHRFAHAHAHVNLLGWVSLAL